MTDQTVFWPVVRRPTEPDPHGHRPFLIDELDRGSTEEHHEHLVGLKIAHSANMLLPDTDGVARFGGGSSISRSA